MYEPTRGDKGAEAAGRPWQGSDGWQGRVLHDREEEDEETIRQLSIDAALDLGSFAHECEVAMA